MRYVCALRAIRYRRNEFGVRRVRVRERGLRVSAGLGRRDVRGVREQRRVPHQHAPREEARVRPDI